MQLLAGKQPSPSLSHLAPCNLINDREQETRMKRAGALGSGGYNARGQERSLYPHPREDGQRGTGSPPAPRAGCPARCRVSGQLLVLSGRRDAHSDTAAPWSRERLLYVQPAATVATFSHSSDRGQWNTRSRKENSPSHQPGLRRAREGTEAAPQMKGHNFCVPFPSLSLSTGTLREQTQTPEFDPVFLTITFSLFCLSAHLPALQLNVQAKSESLG